MYFSAFYVFNFPKFQIHISFRVLDVSSYEK